ncbi:MAG: hypothetical protein GX577_05320 [Leptolinea sp.]|nr:hypothetical protein [Leptolinea sp.]
MRTHEYRGGHRFSAKAASAGWRMIREGENGIPWMRIETYTSYHHPG